MRHSGFDFNGKYYYCIADVGVRGGRSAGGGNGQIGESNTVRVDYIQLLECK